MSDENMTGRELPLHDHYDYPGCDRKCPVCGADLAEYSDVTFEDGLIVVSHTCPECGSDMHFNYWINNVIVDRDGRF